MFVKQISSLVNKSKAFLLITLCLFSCTSFSNAVDESASVPSCAPVELDSVVREKLFLDKILISKDNDFFRVLIKPNKEDDIKSLKILGKDLKFFDIFDGIAITISKADLLNQIDRGKIISVWENSVITAAGSDTQLTSLSYTRDVDDYNSKVKSQALWDLGFYGNDTIVAILDTGIKSTHPALNVNMDNENRIIDGWNFIENNANYEDDNGHGTKVAGIIGGNGLAGYDRGVAPNCDFLIGKILSYDATGTVEDLIEGLDWAIANGADVINLSLGKDVTEKDSPEVEAVNNAVESGIVVCVASGNSRGDPSLGYNDKYTVLSPGISMKAITVGAVDNNSVLYEKSSAGPIVPHYNQSSENLLLDSPDFDETWMKPDVVAPGVLLNTTSTHLQGTTLASGTSYSTAVVSGVCSLLKQVYPDQKPSVLKASLLETSESLVIDYISPYAEHINFLIPETHQGAGLVDVNESRVYLQNPNSITVWPSNAPYLRNIFLKNERHSFYIHLFINKEINRLSLILPAPLSDFFSLSIPSFYDIGQYDLLVNFTTENLYTGHIVNSIDFNVSSEIFSLNIDFQVRYGKGRILFDVSENGNQQFYSMFGNLHYLYDFARSYGLTPQVLNIDGDAEQLSQMNLNDFEVIALINPSFNSLTSLDEAIISDYIYPGGEYQGGTLIILPSDLSNVTKLNSILGITDIVYTPTGLINETIDLTLEAHRIASYPSEIQQLFIPSPFEVIRYNDSLNSIADRFAYYDNRENNGSLIIAANDLDMFLNSPYLYNEFKINYDISNLVLNFGDNLELLENIISNSVETLVDINYTISELEVVQGKETLEIRTNAVNTYKPLTNWDFYLTIEKNGIILARSYDVIDYENGTHLLVFNPANFSISPQKYTLAVRSSAGTYYWTIRIIANVSWGPIVVEISLALCIVYLLIVRKKRPKS